ncbi:hypothetical protein ABIB15_000500 [Marisediminicola sp. UYEF4]|uniref:hypothetical protein n=1 Tax=Marisediminicola sp. UYEF4 TaxID=1756384 RepID=UPI003397BFAA
MPRSRLLLLLGVTAPALACALVGLTHPMRLTVDTALYWRNVHIALIFVFPLIGLAPWLIARRVNRRLGWIAALGGYGFATLYTALDILAGVAAGALALGGEADATGPVYAIARVLARIGVWALIAGVVVAGIAAFLQARLAAVPGLVLAAVGAYLVYPGHIYFPVGTAAMGLLAAGFALLALAVTRAPARVDAREATAAP